MNGRRSFFYLCLLIICASFVSGCQSFALNYNEKNMLPLTTPVKELSTAVESAVRYRRDVKYKKDQELLGIATRHDPALLKPFTDYKIKAKGEKKHAFVLICTADGEYALMGDAGCTKEVDHHYWTQAKTPCDIDELSQRSCGP